MMKKVLEYQRQLGLIEDGDRIVAGFSGGADSVCLLLVLEELKKQYDFTYCAVHVEHGIRGEESLADAEFAKSFCQDRQIPFYLYHMDAPKKARDGGLSLEEAARELRYECFAQAKKVFDGHKIAVAHHGDDNAETMIFHMSRGTGLRGLAGILPKRDQIIRPLLCVTRQEIEEYLAKRQQSYCTDSTNEELEYSRNRIRKNILPQLEALNPKAVEHMAKLSEQLAEAHEYIRDAAWGAGQDAICVQEEYDNGTKQIFLDKEKVLSMAPVLQKEFLHQVLGLAAGSHKDIGMIHVESLRQLLTADTSKQVNLPYKLIAVVEYNRIRIMPQETDLKDNEYVPREAIQIPLGEVAVSEMKILLPKEQTVSLKIFDFDGEMGKIPEKTYTKWFDYDKIRGNVFLRTRQVGDYLVVNQQGNQKKLKDYFINEKIPKDQREDLLLLAEESHILWVVGHRISQAYKITPQTKRILEVRIEREN